MTPLRIRKMFFFWLVLVNKILQFFAIDNIGNYFFHHIFSSFPTD